MIPLYSKETRENKISHSLLSKAIKGESPEIESCKRFILKSIVWQSLKLLWVSNDEKGI